jgi:hypothetical protein
MGKIPVIEGVTVAVWKLDRQYMSNIPVKHGKLELLGNETEST